MKIQILRTAFVGALITLSSFAFSKTYYCSPTGSGSGTSYGSPCSFSTGLGKLAAGDTLYLLGGQYDFNSKQTIGTSKNGKSASARTFIGAYPGETPIFDFRMQPYGSEVTGSNNVGISVSAQTQHIHFKGITIRYAGKNGIINYGSQNVFETLDVYGNGDSGMQMKDGGNNKIINCDSHDNCDYKLDKSGKLTQCDFGGNADGFADKQHSGASNHYIGCRAWNNSDDGWDCFARINSGSTTPTIIENCVCYKNGPTEYDMRNHPRYQVDKSWFDQFAGNGRDVVDADGNTVHISLQHYANMGNGNGFKVGGQYTVHNVKVHHCLAVANTVKGFDQNNDGGEMWFYNCTGYLNGRNYGFTTAYGKNTLVNCISLQSNSKDSYAAQTVVRTDHNSWNTSGVSATAADFQSLDTTEILRPRLADGNLLIFSNQGTLLHLVSGSEMKDAGVDVGLPFMGKAPEMGYWEIDGVQRPSLALTNGPKEQWVSEGEAIRPITFTWGGTDNKPTSKKPQGITSQVSNTNHTVRFEGSIAAAGTYQIVVTTAGDSCNVTEKATIHVRSAKCKKVAYVTSPDSPEDATILQWLGQSDSIVVSITDASDASIDYSSYDVLVLGSKPKSDAAGFAALKGMDKPMVILKPFLFKNSVWNWGTPVNSADLSIVVSDTTHAIFQGINFEGETTLQVFNQVNTNAVTSISTWTDNASVTSLATPENSENDAIAELPAGSTYGGVTLSKRVVMIGFSEYSTVYLNEAGLRIIENAIYYQLGMPTPEHPTDLEVTISPQIKAEKFLQDGRIYIRCNGHIYTCTGLLIQ